MRIVDDCCSGVMSLSLVEPNVLVRGRLKLRVILPYVLIEFVEWRTLSLILLDYIDQPFLLNISD